MPVPDPRAGQAFIWFISCFLFLSITFGGGCLMAYVLLHDSPFWLPYVGVTFVCLPWLFWIFTFLYRIVSRAFGFRMVLGDGGGGRNSNAANTTGISGSVTSDHLDHEPATTTSTEESNSVVTPRRVLFGEAVVLGEQNGDGSSNGGGNKNMKKRSSFSSSSNSSIASHESEMPLAISMAT